MSRSSTAVTTARMAALTRRRWLGIAATTGLGLTGLNPEVQVMAQQAGQFVMGPPMPDIAPVQVSARVWMVPAADGFPTPANQGMMSNVTFVVTSAGVVILDSGSSLQIGQMVIRMIRRITPLPVVAVFNSHHHGDHWLGNHAFVDAFGESLPIYSLADTRELIAGVAGNEWRSMMERWTNQSTAGTKTVLPNRTVMSGQVIQIGDVTFRMHHFSQAHTTADLCVQVEQERVTHVGDIAMTNRIANFDDGSYRGTFTYYERLRAATGEQKWVPGHGESRHDLLQRYEALLRGIWEPCLQAVKDDKSEAEAKALVMKDARVQARAATMQGFEGNIGKYISLAYLEAEKEAF
jgi:glyoxylase-like metal-dependent hydrolase (beta-lactamase superfamily II)